MKQNISKLLFISSIIYCLSSYGNSAIALFIGIIFASTLGNPFAQFTKKRTSSMLQVCVVGLGAGMNLNVVGKVGISGIGYTLTGILLTALAGFLLTRFYKTPPVLSTLITVGTAICGGSAIAAIGPTVDADNESMSTAFGVVFILNAIALLLFPFIGHILKLDQHQFGMWAALAIHDTSSVVGASMSYGAEALALATTIKLARALWIIPLSLCFAFFMKSKNKVKIPWFIFLFILASALVTWVPSLIPYGQSLSMWAKKLLVVTLLFIGLNLNWLAVKKVGIRPLLLGLSLWLIVGCGTLIAITTGLIK